MVSPDGYPLGRVRKRISEIAAGMVSGCGVSVATSYTWNLRGQLTGVTSPAFSQTLSYDSGANPLYNGNIGSMTLSYGGEAVTRSYSYDGLNRLAGSTSGDGFNTSYSYDLNSNPLDIERYGLTTVGVTGIVDDITMSYDGNRLSGGYDSAEEVLLENSSDMPPGEFSCEYDAEGRLIADSSRGISGITYSYSGMPLEITLDNGSIFRYRYTADDVRVRERYSGVPTITGRKKITSYTVRYFIGVMELEDFGFESKDIGWTPSPQVGSLSLDPSSATFPALPGSRLKPVMKRISLPWGYLDQHGARYTYINDHQGNVRAVVDQNGVAVQTTDYYPYGLPMATSTNPDVNRRKHTGKEYESRGGLNSYDFTARQYNPVTLRMDRIDPFSGKYHGFSPYVFCAANPILFTDPSGKEWMIFKNSHNKVESVKWVEGDAARDQNGKLKNGVYSQVIIFVDQHTFDESKDSNIGSTLAYVLNSEGHHEVFNACTHPSDLSKFPTIPEGTYEAKVGKHSGSSGKSYDALRLSDVGTKNFGDNKIELGFPNPSNTNKTTANWINIHKPGNDDKTKTFKKKDKSTGYYSEGCFLISRKQWDSFMSNFNNEREKKNVISVIVLRERDIYFKK